MAPVLGDIFRKSMDAGEVPSKWKEAHIIPIHKKDNKAVMANFLPVALTSVICKVFERIMFRNLSFLTRNGLTTAAWVCKRTLMPDDHFAMFGTMDGKFG